MIIDTHTHIFDAASYKTYFEKANGRINKAFSLHFRYTFDEPGGKIRRFELEKLLKFVETKDNLFLVGSVNLEGDVAAQLHELDQLFKDKKIIAIKMYPGYQHFYPSDEKVFPVAKLCEKYDKPLIFHSGDVFDFAGTAVLKYSHPIHVDGLAMKHPSCKIVIAHFGFPYLLETANVVSKNKNVFTEISGTITKMDTKQEMENIIHQYASDLRRVFAYFPDVKEKTMFGTDYGGENTPLNQVDPYIMVVENVFSKEEQDAVFHATTEKVFNL